MHMSILREIQESILQESVDLGTTLLRLRFLASRLGSDSLEDWVKYEAEGYPATAEVPDYRIAPVTYKGTFSGYGGSGISNAPIPSYLVEKYAGEQWTRHEFRESIAGIQQMAKSDTGVHLSVSNLMLLLQGKVYAGYACNSVTGELSVFSIREIVQSVRARILELTIELEKRVPQAVDVTLQNSIEKSAERAAAVTQVFYQTIHGNVTHVTASDNATVTLSISAGDQASMIGALIKAGIPDTAAKEITEIISSEKPDDVSAPLGKKALSWIKKNVPKAAGGVWKIGSSIATDVLTEAALRYYGLKT
jgi:hypothetical protein